MRQDSMEKVGEKHTYSQAHYHLGHITALFIIIICYIRSQSYIMLVGRMEQWNILVFKNLNNNHFPFNLSFSIVAIILYFTVYGVYMNLFFPWTFSKSMHVVVFFLSMYCQFFDLICVVSNSRKYW